MNSNDWAIVTLLKRAIGSSAVTFSRKVVQGRYCYELNAHHFFSYYMFQQRTQDDDVFKYPAARVPSDNYIIVISAVAALVVLVCSSQRSGV